MSPQAPCVYGLIDPADGRTYYVGQTVCLRLRLNAHYSSGVNGYVLRWVQDGEGVTGWVKALRRAGRRPQAVVLEVDPPDGLRAAERRWVTRCLARGEPLLNRTLTRAGEQLALDLPFPEDKRRRFPLRRWREATGWSKRELFWACAEVMGSYHGLYGLIDRLERGHYEAARETPSDLILERLAGVHAVTGLTFSALLRPSRHLSDPL